MKNLSLFLTLFSITCVLIIDNSMEITPRNRRRGRTLFHEDQDVLITMIIIFPYYFPLWERFYNTSVELGTDAALAEFPIIPPGGLSPCGPFCRKRRSLKKRTGRTFEYDEQLVYFLIELIAAYSVPIIPNPYAVANRKPMRPKTGFNALPGLSGLREVAGLLSNMLGVEVDDGLGPIGSRPNSVGPIPTPIPQGIDDIRVEELGNGTPIGQYERKSTRSRSLALENTPLVAPYEEIGTQSPRPKILEHSLESPDNNQTTQRNLCFSSGVDFRSSRSIKENCFLNSKNSHILSAYETVTLDRKRGISTLKLNWSSLMSTVICHFTEWYLKKVNFLSRNFFLGSIKTICSNTRLVLFFTVFQKYCKCLILKKLI